MTLCAAIVSLACAAVAGSAPAAPPSVHMHVAFVPYRPGALTTVAVGFNVSSSNGTLPPPLTRLSINLPEGMGLGMTDLGEATCSVPVLKTWGPKGCPPNSFMGLGHGLVEIQIGSLILREPVAVAILMTKAQHEHTTLIFQAEGWSPAAAEEIFMGQLLESGPRSGATLVTEIPLIRPWPGAPYVALASMYTTVGPQHLKYFRHLGKEWISYKPRGIAIPRACPSGGYRFRASFTFLGYAPQIVTPSVPCLNTRRRHRHNKG